MQDHEQERRIEFAQTWRVARGQWGDEWWTNLGAELWTRLKGYGHMNVKLLVAHLLDTYDFKPKLSQIMKAVRTLRLGQVQLGDCRSCDGKRGQVVYLRDRRTGLKNTGWFPCVECALDRMRHDKGELWVEDRIREHNDRYERITPAEFYEQPSKESEPEPEPAAAPVVAGPTTDSDTHEEGPV